MPRPMSCAADSFDDRDSETNCTDDSRAIFIAHSPTLAQEGIQMRQRSDYPTFSGDEIERRHKSVYGLMEQEDVDAIVFYGSGRYASDIYWLSDWPSSREAYLLMQRGKEPVILMQLFNHYPMARVMSWIKDVRRAGAKTTICVFALVYERGLE